MLDRAMDYCRLVRENIANILNQAAAMFTIDTVVLFLYIHRYEWSRPSGNTVYHPLKFTLTLLRDCQTQLRKHKPPFKTPTLLLVLSFIGVNNQDHLATLVLPLVNAQ